jgi:hypothetical protein
MDRSLTVKGKLPHSDFSDMDTFVPAISQLCRRIAGYSLVKHQTDRDHITQATSLSVALSSRFAAANASAC